MPFRTTVDIPEPLHDRVLHIAEKSGVSIRSLIVRALEQTYYEKATGEYITGPPIRGSGKLGPAFPDTENPHDLVFS
ncbi:MAG: ribbon-helix-helix domain-containing protein [Acidobacteriota bacterium]|nr:ribbon-helix-helix domain-containing protein [Acidobacteriota bacterium]